MTFQFILYSRGVTIRGRHIAQLISFLGNQGTLDHLIIKWIQAKTESGSRCWGRCHQFLAYEVGTWVPIDTPDLCNVLLDQGGSFNVVLLGWLLCNCGPPQFPVGARAFWSPQGQWHWGCSSCYSISGVWEQNMHQCWSLGIKDQRRTTIPGLWVSLFIPLGLQVADTSWSTPFLSKPLLLIQLLTILCQLSPLSGTS